MHIIRDFFLLIWGKELSLDAIKKARDLGHTFHVKYEVDHEAFSESAAVVLASSFVNFQKFSSLDIFCEIIHFFHEEACEDSEALQRLQAALLAFIQDEGGKSLAMKITGHIEALRKGSILGYDEARKIVSMLDLVEDKEKRELPDIPLPQIVEVAVSGNYYKDAVARLIQAVQNLEQIVEASSLKERLSVIPQKLHDASFSIGITGVMNAGKSTMLNALLGKEVLGTSVVPETANLTVVKYAKEEYAQVNFWSKSEWARIEESAKHLPSIAAFLKETHNVFGESLLDFITEEGRSDRASIEGLASYTSAKHSGKKCNLVKSVELYTDLEFVKDGVQIVDTPGLDDPVIQREEITKGYLSDCDLMIHLMNVNQSATEKDVEFIIDALTYQSISRLLIVITRIDTVTPKELQEVIDYTKSSIKAQLERHNQGAKFDSIIAKIDFLPIAGKLALMHRMGESKEAEALGYDLEKTGIPALERYLAKVLFGSESDKATLLVEGTRKELFNVIGQSKKLFTQEQTNLGMSADALKATFEEKKQQNEISRATISTLRHTIQSEKVALEEYFTTLYRFAEGKLETLKRIIKQRILDDVSYEERKNRKKPDQERLKTMVEFGMKDGIIDLVRDYRFQFQKRMASSMENIASHYESFKTHEQTNPHTFDAKGYFEEHFGGAFLSGSNAVLIEQVLIAVKSAKKGDLEGLDRELDRAFTVAIMALSTQLMPTLQQVNGHLLSGFTELVFAPARTMEAAMRDEEEELTKQIVLLETRADDAKVRLNQLYAKVERLALIEAQLQGGAA